MEPPLRAGSLKDATRHQAATRAVAVAGGKARCVYSMRMARVNVYLPDELAEEARAAGLNVSGLAQEAVRGALTAGHTDEWLADVAKLPRTGVTHEDVVAAVEQARRDLDA